MRLLAINGSYREDGIIDQAVATAVRAAAEAGAEVETIYLRSYPIEFCLNCRECTQLPGESPGHCIQQDGMQALIDKIETADGYILASPTNIGTVTAIYKRFMERLAVYAYWPWGAPAPQMRRGKRLKKKAVLISSSAAPGLMGRLFFNTLKQLRQSATAIGAKSVGTLWLGMVANEPNRRLSDRQVRQIQRRVKTLLGK